MEESTFLVKSSYLFSTSQFFLGVIDFAVLQKFANLVKSD